MIYGPPRVDHLDVVGRLTPSTNGKPSIHSAPLTREPGRAVALGRALVMISLPDVFSWSRRRQYRQVLQYWSFSPPILLYVRL
jgi:hypothetical protein